MTPSQPGGPSAGSFQVGPGMWVRLSYEVFDADGSAVEASAHEVSYVHGYGSLLDPLEGVLAGRSPGAHCSATLAPREAFGARQSQAIVEFDRAEFPEDVSPGDHFEAEREDGGVVVLRVLDVLAEAVVVDTNHPLAGQRVRFELDVLEVRPASSEELSQAEASLHGEKAAEGPLIAVERLLRGPSKRYERGRPSPDAPRVSPPEDEN